MRPDTASLEFRLRSVRGHLDAVIRMVGEDRCCLEVLHQLSAVRGALEQIRHDIQEAHLRTCLSEGRVGDVVDELLAMTSGSSPLVQQATHRCHGHVGATEA